ncbi:hypothetical protein E3N88_29588 [Mikania micrantha]|uniref:Uncharacterized protein n=1 Tax=Mikania micrantha TaxID=192012 RepID=A0A5N6MJA1_9ASTR|nr:hypothetical protein E3N88_29588 [Mikania micrantha]
MKHIQEDGGGVQAPLRVKGFKSSSLELQGALQWLPIAFRDLSSDNLRVPSWRSKRFSAYRDGFREFKLPAHSSRTVMGLSRVLSIPRRVPEDPNRPNFNGLTRFSPFSRLRTIVRHHLNS